MDTPALIGTFPCQIPSLVFPNCKKRNQAYRVHFAAPIDPVKPVPRIRRSGLALNEHGHCPGKKSPCVRRELLFFKKPTGKRFDDQVGREALAAWSARRSSTRGNPRRPKLALQEDIDQKARETPPELQGGPLNQRDGQTR